MFSRGALRTAANTVRSVPAAPFGLGSPLTRSCLEPTRRAVAGQSIEARRFVSAYGYQQAKALVYSQYGEPKDVLKYVLCVLHQQSNIWRGELANMII